MKTMGSLIPMLSYTIQAGSDFSIAFLFSTAELYRSCGLFAKHLDTIEFHVGGASVKLERSGGFGQNNGLYSGCPVVLPLTLKDLLKSTKKGGKIHW
jgi:hypothetical protein